MALGLWGTSTMNKLADLAKSLRGPLSTIPVADIRVAADVLDDMAILMTLLASGEYGDEVREVVEDVLGVSDKRAVVVPVRIPAPGYAVNLVEKLLNK